jgi:hypothetical protein
MFGAADFGGHVQALDRRDFIAALGGSAAVGLMSHDNSPVAHTWRTLANLDAPL